MMRRFIGKIFSSSQPTIKHEADASDVGMADADVHMDTDVDMEDMIRIAQAEQEMLEEDESPKAGKRGKRGRKGKKSRDSVDEPEEQLEGEGDDEEAPELVDTAQEAMDTSGANLDVQGHAEKPKRKRRSSSSTTKRKRKSMEADTPFQPEEVVPDEEENSMVTEVKSASSKGRITRLRKPHSELVEEDTGEDEPAQLKGMNPSSEHERTQAEEQDGEESISADLTDLPKKLQRAKKNAEAFPRQTVQVVIQSAVADDDDLAATLHKPLTPAQKNAQSGASAGSEEEPETTPKKPSKKALGKRKASDIGASIGTSKKRKTQKDRAAGTPDLASFGFIQSSDFERRPTPMFTPINRPRASILPPSAQAPRPPSDHRVDGEADGNLFLPEASILKTSERKKKRRLPVGDDLPTPRTPQNKGPRTSKTPKSATGKSQARTPATARSGKFSNEQVLAISAAVEEFREENGFSQVEINDMIQKDAKSDAVGLWKHIYEEVSDVPHRSIQQLCRRRFHNFEARGQWTEEQDQELRDAYEKHPAKWKQIGEMLNRFSEDCRDRWRNYTVCGDNLGKGAWTKEEEERLKEVVEECIKSIREMKRVSTDARDKAKSDESLIDWRVVSQRMDHTRSRLQCMQKWKVMKEREEVVINDPVLDKPISETWRVVEAVHVARKMTAKEKLLLLYAVRETGAGREGKIPWRRVKEDVPGKLKKMTMKIAFRQMRQHIEGNADMALQDIVDLLVDAYEASVPSEPAGFNDDFELVLSSQKILSNKKKSKSREKIAAEADVEYSSDDNGEGPSTITKPKRKARLSEQFVAGNENEPADIYAIPRDEPLKKSKRRKTASLLAQETPVSSSASKNKRKLRERMKSIGQSQSQSQEGNEQQHSELSDVHTALESLKTGNSRARRAAAKEAAKSKGKQILSEERVVESEDEVHPLDEEPPTEHPTKFKRKRGLGKPFPSEERLVESDEEEAPVPQQLPPVNADMDLDEDVSLDQEKPAVHEDELPADEEPIENAEGEPSEEEPSEIELDSPDSRDLEVSEDEIDLDKHLTAIAPDVAEPDEAETPMDGETQSQDEEELLADQTIEPDDEEPSVDESENEEELPPIQGFEADEDEMDVDYDETTYTAPGGPEPEDDDSLVEDEEEKHVYADQESIDLDAHEEEEEEEEEGENTLHHDQESVDLDAARDTSAHEDMEIDEEEALVGEQDVPPTNGFHEEERSQNYGSDADTDFHGFQTEAGSLDLDTPTKSTQGVHSSSPVPSGEDTPKVNSLLNGLANGYRYHEEEVSSDDDDMSDIPARIVPKATVVETKKEKKPKKDKKLKSKSKKRLSGFK